MKPAVTGHLIIRAAAKGILLFLLLTFAIPVKPLLPILGSISLYNRVVPGRTRLPYSDNPSVAYSLSLSNLEAMFASHEISARPKQDGEFRVLLIGDSSTWGYLLKPGETLSAYLNATKTTLPDGRLLRSYNLGYPVMSLTKDLLILSRCLDYQPDLVIWLVTLESFPYDKQLFPPLVQQNPDDVHRLIHNGSINLDLADPMFDHPPFLKSTLIGQRRELANMVRLQLYGAMWAATGIDQDIPETVPSPADDLQEDINFHDLRSPLQAQDLAFDVLRAGVELLDPVPVIIVNEPMFISRGKNSDIRYNFFYPRWAYDSYRQLLAEECNNRNWRCLDFWDFLPETEFTNTAIHMTPMGSKMFAERLAPAILQAISHKN